jgi:hypothetical protein
LSKDFGSILKTNPVSDAPSVVGNTSTKVSFAPNVRSETMIRKLIKAFREWKQINEDSKDEK